MRKNHVFWYQEKEKLDLHFARYLYSQNIPFTSGGDNELFKTLCSALRPGYEPPKRTKLSEDLLVKVHDEVDERMKQDIRKHSSVLVLSQDSWSSITNNPIIAHSLLVHGNSYLYHLENAGSNTKSAQYCASITSDLIAKIKNDTGKDVGAIVYR